MKRKIIAPHVDPLRKIRIAHDLKNPSGVIREFSKMGLNEKPDSEIFSFIHDASGNLMNIIENISALARVAVGDSIEKEEILLVEFLQNLCQDFTPQLDYNKMTLNVHLDDNLKINANPIIAEVFRNYISNAIKYASIGKEIIIDSEMDDNMITVFVKDFGTSIPQEYYADLFTRKFQIKQGQGRGLGLAIVKRIAIAHNGEAGIKANTPNGNIFYIKLPIL